MRIPLLLVFGLLCFVCQAQSIQNVKATFQEGKVTITYDLISNKPNQKFALDLYGSHNNFTKPLTKVSGDVGKNIYPGTGKKIILQAAQEFTTYRNDITFKVKGELMPMPFIFINPTVGGSMRRGKKTTVTWEGGKPTQNIKLELYQGTNLISTVAETTNTGQYIWNIPKKQSKGSYTLRLTADQEIVTSNAFKIKSKTPFIVKMLPVVAVGGAAAVLLGGGGGSGSKDLPWAPDPN